MSRGTIRTSVVLLAVLLVAAAVSAQVPTVIKFSGVLTGGSSARTVSATFSVYGDPKSDAPLWQETQSIAVDADGRYAVLLGATAPEGLPSAIFASGEARWVGVTIDGDEAGQPRVALVSVPYALKAEDATTIGGRPLSAFVLAGDKTGVGADGLMYLDARVLRSGLAPQGGYGAASPPSLPSGYGATSLATAGSANYLALFTDSTNLGDSALYQAPAGWIGINTTAPAAPLHIAAGEAPGTFFDVYSGASVLGALPVVYRAARGTAAAPTAVQAEDILGGLAVRAYNGSTFTGGRGQVMFKAAENWTTTANGTYLAIATEPIGASTPAAERMRIAADGKVGVGTTAPGQLLSVAGTIESTSGGFKFPDGTVQAAAAGPAGLPSNLSTAVGAGSGGGSGMRNSAFGASSLGSITWGANNSAFGAKSLALATSASSNSAFGLESLSSATSAGSNSAFGAYSLRATTVGNDNVSVGLMSMYSNTVGAYNVAVGSQSLYSATTADFNVASGAFSLTNDTTGHSNVAVGFSGLAANTTGNLNVAVGHGSLNGAMAFSENTAVGSYSMIVPAGGLNTAVGAAALQRGDTENTAVGYHAMYAATGNRNTIVGAQALTAASDASSNTAVGSFALGEATSDYNVAVGESALGQITTGAGNTAVGTTAGRYLTTGANNTFLGQNARVASSTPALSYATAIGSGAIVAANNAMALGGTGSAAVSVGINTSTPDDRLQVVGDIKIGTSGTNGCLKNFAGTGLVGTCSSDLRLKTNVQPFGRVLDSVSRLKPVHFTWRASEFPAYHFGDGMNAGLIAQDVEQVFPELVQTDERGFKTVNYTELPYLTLAAVKELKAENDALKADARALRLETQEMKAALAALAARLAEVEKK
jgi:hypothetical protein